MSKKALSQSLKKSVRKLDKINNVDFKFTGTLKDVMNDPIKWAEEQSERAMLENINKYLEAKKLGEEFWGEVKNKD